MGQTTPPPELLGWLKLARCPGLSARLAHALAAAAGSAAALAPRRLDSRIRALAFPTGVLTSLEDPALEAVVLREWREAEAGGWTLLHPDDPRYPAGLTQLAVPPPILSVRGQLEALSEPAVAVIGTRRPTGYGLRIAQEIGGDLAAAGIVIVSGLAFGIDSAAHAATLQAGGKTVAVMGTGRNRIYPRQHQALADQITRRGALVTEFAPDAPPARDHFPRRNRIIAALSAAVVVVEASSRSGTLITVDWALEQGLTVCAVPGRVGDPQSEGTLALLRDGATMICSAADVLTELGWSYPGGEAGEAPKTKTSPGPGPEIHPLGPALWASLPQDDSIALDQLLEDANSPPANVLECLFCLQVAGWIERCPGNRFRRRHPGRPSPPV